jgi:hypothetical protein
MRDSRIDNKNDRLLSSSLGCINLESVVEHGFVGNPGVPGKTSFTVNGYSLNKNDNVAGASGFFYKFLQRYKIH